MAPEPPHHPGRILARLSRQVELAVAGVELTLSQYRALIMLGEGPEAASALAEKLAVSRPSLTGVIDGLVARGLVDREGDPSDRRRISLGLTAAGRELLGGADAEVERRLHDIAEYRPDGPQEAFAGLAPWQEALEHYRAARRAGAPPAGTREQAPA